MNYKEEIVKMIVNIPFSKWTDEETFLNGVKIKIYSSINQFNAFVDIDGFKIYHPALTKYEFGLRTRYDELKQKKEEDKLLQIFNSLIE